ncbi:hypothetical protein [Chryseobacterium sp.]|uniref:hypothetical protein n=1 Tax=Chryseobacterium sp. TaxID=1871047 RepID=UPI002899E66F|nr:hypothetical protein [Chryseobacterium sp.]
MKKFILAGIITLGGIITSNAQCKTISTLTESFDTWKDIDKCWTAKAGKAMLYTKDKQVVFDSMTSPRENMYLVTPKIKAGNYTLTLDASDNGGETTLEIFTVGNAADTKSYASVSKPAKITGNKQTFNISLKKDSNVGLKVMLNGIHQAVYLDNFSLKAKK